VCTVFRRSASRTARTPWRSSAPPTRACRRRRSAVGSGSHVAKETAIQCVGAWLTLRSFQAVHDKPAQCGSTCFAPGLVGGDEDERARASLTNFVSWWLGLQGIARSRVRGQRVLQIGLEDLEPCRRLGAPLDDASSRRAVEEAGLEKSGRPLLAHRVSPTLGEDDVHTGEIAVVAVTLQRPSQRVGGPERWRDEAASRIVEQVSRIAGRVLGRWPGRCRIRAHDVVDRRVAWVGRGPIRVWVLEAECVCDEAGADDRVHVGVTARPRKPSVCPCPEPVPRDDGARARRARIDAASRRSLLKGAAEVRQMASAAALLHVVRCGTEHVTGAIVAAEARRRAVGVHD
jgi:hypothetical protein